MSWPIMALSLLSGAIFGFCFPPFNLHFLIWLSFIPLLGFQSHGWKDSLKIGFIFGLSANAIIFFWIWKTFIAAHVPWPLIFTSWILLASVLALYFSAFKFFYDTYPQNFLKPFSAAALWTILEYIRGIILTGFPWAFLSHTQYRSPLLIQISSITGAYGVSFIILFVNSSIFEFFRSFKNKSLKDAAIFLSSAFVLMGAVLIFGHQSLRDVSEKKQSLKIGILQGNIDQYQKWDSTYEDDIREKYETLANKASQQHPDVILWPESSVPAWFPNQKPYSEWISRIAQKTKTFHIIGAVNQTDGNDFNSAFLISPEGKILSQYSKNHLVPFGEYVPLEKILKSFVPYIGQIGTFTAGTQPGSFNINGILISPTICYEAIFPSLVRKAAKSTRLTVNLTNDGWYLDTGAPEQHFCSSVFRAIENHQPVIRVANTGISAFIDERGRIINETKLNTRGALIETIAFSEKTTSTFYTEHGDIFIFVCLLIFSFSLLFILYTPTHVKRT